MLDSEHNVNLTCQEAKLQSPNELNMYSSEINDFNIFNSSQILL